MTGHRSARGFSIAELLLGLATVGLMVLLGFVAYQQFFKPKTMTTVSSTPAIIQPAVTDCSVSSDKLSNNTQWKTITGTEVQLSDWGVSFTIDPSLSGSAVCTEDSNGYRFSLKAVINSDSCRQEYQYSELSMVGLQVIRLAGTADASGQISGATGTITDYYAAHKASDGSYFADQSTPARKYYSIGNYFIVGFGDTDAALTSYHDARTGACPGVAPDYTTQFVDALKTIHAS